MKPIYIDDHDGADWIKRVSRTPVAASANADHSGSSIVAWTPSIKEADDLCLPDGETSDHLHCTLVYLGPSEAVPDSVPDIVSAIAARFSPFTAHAQGTAIFNTDEGDVLVRLLDAPELEQLQQRLHDEIAAVMDVPDSHGFTAHVTLKYLDPEEAIDPEWFKLPALDVQVGAITTNFGNDRTDYPLATEVTLGDSEGHAFHGNQYVEGTGSAGTLTTELVDWAQQFPAGTAYRAMHREDLHRVLKSGVLDSKFDAHRSVWGGKHVLDAEDFLYQGKVIVAYKVNDEEAQGAGSRINYVNTLPLPSDRILGVFDPKDAPAYQAKPYEGDLSTIQRLEFGDVDQHPFHGNQWIKVGAEKGEWESTGGQPRLAPLETKRGQKNAGRALPIEMITMKSLPPEIRSKVMERVRERVASTQKINASFDHYMDVAWNNPELREGGMNWYQQTHDLAMQVADQHDIEPQNVAAAFAAMSPGKEWSEEAGIIQGMADMDQGNVHLSEEKLDLVNQKMDLYEMDHVDNGDSYGDMDSRQAVITMQSQFMEEDRGSWGVGYGYGNFAKGLDLLRGENVDDALPGPKVRSFTNNIMDPSDPRDVTIDIHMVQGSARDPAVVNDSGVMSSPSYQGASIGIYPYIADVVRREASDYGILPQQAQALIWLGYKSENSRSGSTGINE